MIAKRTYLLFGYTVYGMNVRNPQNDDANMSISIYMYACSKMYTTFSVVLRNPETCGIRGNFTTKLSQPYHIMIRCGRLVELFCTALSTFDSQKSSLCTNRPHLLSSITIFHLFTIHCASCLGENEMLFLWKLCSIATMGQNRIEEKEVFGMWFLFFISLPHKRHNFITVFTIPSYTYVYYYGGIIHKLIMHMVKGDVPFA